MFKKSLIFFLSFLFIMPALALEMQVDRDSIASDEMLTVVISSNDHISITPDLSPLKKDFSIVGTSQSSQFNMINGTTHMETRWQVALMPKHSGDILLPAIQVGSETTPSRLIHVTEVKSNIPVKATQNQDIFIEAAVIPKESYIQEQFVYTLKLYYNRSIENPYLMAPDLADAKISPNGQDILYTTVKNGKYFHVLERSYLITPKNTGQFQIQPPMLKGYLEGTTDMVNVYGFSSRTLKPIQIVGPTLTISVKPKPASFKGQWLPAKKLTLSASWESEPPVFREGEPITRIIEVNAQGATGEQIPNLVIPSSQNLNSYPQQPKRETSTSGNIQVGKLTQKIVYIPTQPGKIALPPIKISWWNSTTKKEQIAQIPAKIVKVLPALIKTPATDNVQPAPTVPVATKSPVVKQNTALKEKSGFTQVKENFWPILAVISIIAWLTTLMLLRRQRRVGSDPKPRFKWGMYNTLPDIQRQLKQACENNKAKQARALFLKWAVIYWKNSSLHALTDVVHILEEERALLLKAEIMQLEAIFYSKNKTLWDGKGLWRSLQNYLKLKEEKINQVETDPLPPLYCSGSETS